MKLDLLKNQWIDIVFEGRNRNYGAYDLRKSITKNTTRSFIIGAVLFAFAVSIPKLMSLIPEGGEEETLNQKITTVKLPPKAEKPKENLPPPPPPPPKVDQVKFVKPVVARADEVVEEVVVIKEIKDKTIGNENLKGNDEADYTVAPVGKGEVGAVVEEVDDKIYSSAGLEVQPEYPGGIQKFYSFVQKNYQMPDEEGLKGKVYVTFVVEKDGSLTDIRVIRDIGYGTGKEAIRVLKSASKWRPAEQNGKPVRCTYSLPISLQSAE